jgi:hypothetical protein
MDPSALNVFTPEGSQYLTVEADEAHRARVRALGNNIRARTLASGGILNNVPNAGRLLNNGRGANVPAVNSQAVSEISAITLPGREFYRNLGPGGAQANAGSGAQAQANAGSGAQAQANAGAQANSNNGNNLERKSKRPRTDKEKTERRQEGGKRSKKVRKSRKGNNSKKTRKTNPSRKSRKPTRKNL